MTGAALTAWLDSDPACWSWSIPAGLPPLADCDQRLVALGLITAEQATAGWLEDGFHAGRCAICGNGRGDVTDHCHRTGLVRGNLCLGCNVREGVHQAAGTVFAKYRERPPAVILGRSERYYGRGYPKGADPMPWVVDALGPLPSEPSAAAAYLATAARLDEPQPDWTDNAANGIGL